MSLAYNYGPIGATATALIDKFGRNVTLRSEIKSGPSYAPVITNSDSIIRAVVRSFKAREIDGTIIQASDKSLLTVSPVTVADKIIDAGVAYSVVQVHEIKPGGTAVLHAAVLRK